MDSRRRLMRTERMLDRFVAGFLAIGACGALFGAWRFLGEIVQLHAALRGGVDSVENLDPGTALPTVYVLGGFTLGFAVLFGAVAVLILRASPLGFATLRGGVVVTLPALLLAVLATYIRYQEYVDAMPPASRTPVYRGVIIGEVLGGGIGVAGVVAALLVLVGVGLVQWFRPGGDPWAAPVAAPVAAPREPRPVRTLGSSASSINAARILALAGTVVGLLVPVAWVRPLGAESDLPTEWSFVALLSGLLAVGALLAAGLCVLARPGRLLFRWLALGALGVVAAVEWTVTLWQSFYADVAYGAERIDGVTVPWTAAVAGGLIGAGLLTAAVVVLLRPAPADETTAAPAVTVTRRGDGPAPERIGEASPEPAWQAFPDPPESNPPKNDPPKNDPPAGKKKRKKNSVTRTADSEPESR